MPDEKLIIRPKLPRGEDGHKVLSIRIKEETIVKIEDIAAETGHTRNALIGIMLEYALKNYEVVLDE